MSAIQNNSNQTAFLKQLAKGLAAQFGQNCEVVVHDLLNGPDNTIVAIENGHVTGRRAGDGASRIVDRALQDPDAAVDRLGYLTRTQDGRLLRSSSIYLRDASGRPTALLGINYDFTQLNHAASILTAFAGLQPDGPPQSDIDTIFSNVNHMLDKLIEESAAHVGKPVALMSRADKIAAIRYLDERGAFLIKKSGDKVSRFFDISKHTLYNYLDSKNNTGEDKRDRNGSNQDYS